MDLGEHEVHISPLLDADAQTRSDSNSSVGTLREGTPPVNLQWIVALGAREVHFTPLFDVDPHFRSDSNFSVGALREGTPLVNLRWIVDLERGKVRRREKERLRVRKDG